MLYVSPEVCVRYRDHLGVERVRPRVLLLGVREMDEGARAAYYPDRPGPVLMCDIFDLDTATYVSFAEADLLPPGATSPPPPGGPEGGGGGEG